MKLSRIIIILIGILIKTFPVLQAQDFLQKARTYLDAGECEKAQKAYNAYKVEHPNGNAEVERRIAECENSQHRAIDSCYNIALKLFIKGNYDAAKSILAHVNSTDAKTSYFKAVLSARLKDEEGVYSNLATAIRLENSYKITAKRDAEFKRYRHSDRFKQMVK